ncbi:CpaE family protein [Paenibacillus aestuarii]|uniref:CpaE family protein n=1 Tax=Paenibacillus aestuarii TaxID=516965 RepID=A0ABW0K7Y8_9BACL
MKFLFGLTHPKYADAISGSIPEGHEVVYCFSQSEIQRAFEKHKGFECVAVSEDLFTEMYPWDWMSSLRKMCSVKTEIHVLLSENSDSLYREIIKRIAGDLHISLIPSCYTQEELIREIRIRLFKDKIPVNQGEGNLISVMSSSPKDGATTIAISAAICMAEQTDKKVCLIDGNLKSPEIRDHLRFKGDKGYPLIQADCDSQSLDSNSLLKACEKIAGVKNLYVLTGLQRREWAEKISLHEISHLLSVAKETFDIVIVDVHTFPDQAATVKCMKEADHRLVVVQPIVTSYQSSWHDWFNSVWSHFELTEKDFSLVLNRDVKSSSSHSIEKSIGTKVISRVRDTGGEGIKAINYGVPMYLAPGTDLSEFKEDIIELSALLSERMGIEFIRPVTETKSKKLGFAIPFLKKLQ